MGYNTTSSVGCQNQMVKAQELVKQPVTRALRAGAGEQGGPGQVEHHHGAGKTTR